jgi:hypothetical protein
MRRLYAWLVGLVGGAAAYRALKKPARAPIADPSDPAEELKAKLAEARAAEAVPVEAVDEVEARRQAVHERGRAALDDMRDD